MADCISYHLPHHVSQHVDFIKPGVALSPPMVKKTKLRKRQTAEEQALTAITEIYASEIQNVTALLLDVIANKTEAASRAKFLNEASALLNKTDTCAAFITPQCVRALYDLPAPGSTPVDPANALGLFEADGQLWDQRDLNSYFERLLQYARDGK